MIPIDIFYKNNDIDPNFDENSYQERYPETKDFYQQYCNKFNISNKARLYYHYYLYNKSSYTESKTNLSDIEIFYTNHEVDSDFEHDLYAQYPDVSTFYADYCEKTNISNRQRLFFHYIKYGRSLGFKKNPSTVYVKPTQGLCNRLLLIDSVFAFAQENNFDFIKICWTKSEGFSSETFEELFDTSILPKNIEIIDLDRYNLAKDKYFRLENQFQQDQTTLEYVHTNREQTLNYIKSHTFTYESYASLDWIFNIGLPMRYTFLKTYIKPNPDLQEQIDQIQIDRSHIGIHIRRGDAILSPWSEYFNISKDDYFKNIIHNIDNKFYLSTDSSAVHHNLVDKYKEKLIYNPNKSFVKDNLTINDNKDQQKSAVIDLFCLAKTHKIFGTNWSTFSLVSSIIGDSRLEIPDSMIEYSLPKLSAIVAIKDRFNVLKTSIHSWLLNEIIKEIIIVDWSSNDIDVNYLLSLDNRIKIIRIENQPNFHLSNAYNVAIQNTTFDHIIKLDVDYFINPYFKLQDWLHINWEKQFLTGCWKFKDIDNSCGFLEYMNGFIAIKKEHLINIGMYKGNKYGYGYDDCDLYERLEKTGLKRRTINLGKNNTPIFHIPHSDFNRTKYYTNKNPKESILLNQIGLNH